MRYLIECTYVFEHPQDNSGIQRVVRNVINNLSHLETKVECIPLIIKHGKTYQVTQLAPSRKQEFRLSLQSWLSVQHGHFGRLRHRVHLYKSIRIDTDACRNSPLRSAALTLTCSAANLAFTLPQKCLGWLLHNKVDKSRAQEIHPQPDDVLVLLDSSWHAEFFPVAECLKSQGIRIVSVIYDLIPLTHPQFCDTPLVEVFERWFDWIARTADGFIAISQTINEQVQHEVQHRLGEGTAAQRWFDYFQLGSDLDQASPRAMVRQEVKQMFEQRPIYLMVSTIEPRKNHSYLLDAFEQLWAEGLDAGLCFVGKMGWRTEQLIERVQQHPRLNTHLFMWNDLTDSELEYSYVHARSLVFPSYVEGFGLPLVESMQRTLPVMASDIPVFREIGGNTVAYFNPTEPDTLAQLVKQFETTGVFPAEDDISEWDWPTWNSSAQQLISRIQENEKMCPLPSKKGSTQHPGQRIGKCPG